MSRVILIIDDDPIYRLLTEKFLSLIDNSIIICQCDNGKIGLEKLNEYLNNANECIILLDLNMPVLDGWGVLDKMHSNQLISNPNIILYIVSSSTDKVDIEKAKQYSIVRKFYHKPLSMFTIKEILKKK